MEQALLFHGKKRLRGRGLKGPSNLGYGKIDEALLPGLTVAGAGRQRNQRKRRKGSRGGRPSQAV